MDKNKLERLMLRVHAIGFATTLPLYLALTFLSAVVFFRFDGRMIGWYGITFAIGFAALIIPYLLVLLSLYRRLNRSLLPLVEGGSGSRVPGKREQLFMERYPLYMGMSAFLALSLGNALATLVIYLAAEYNPWLSFYYFATGFSISLVCGYLQAYIIFSVMKPLRSAYYAVFPMDRRARGLSLRGRIFALAALFLLVPLILGWVTSALVSFFNVRNDLRDRCLGEVQQLAAESRESREGFEEALREAVTPAEDGLLVLLDEAGQPVLEIVKGAGVDREKAEKALEELRKGNATALSRRSDLVAAAASVPGTGYILVEVAPLAPFMRYNLTNLGLFVLLGALFLTVGMLLTKMTADSFTVPLHRLEEAAAEVAGGDLTVKVDPAAADEVGYLTLSFSIMVDNLHRLSSDSLRAAEETSEGAEGVSATTEELQASVEQLSSVIQQLAENAAAQSRTAESVFKLIEDIYQALETSSHQADEGAEASRASSKLAEEGRKDAQEAVEKMRAVRDSINETASIIQSLGAQTGEIGVIVEIIDNIADQTNLLALNAAIEAARAQEHGRGFSVVAEEVRKLAEESAQSTARISGLVREIQRNAAAAVDITMRGTEDVHAGMQAVEVAGQSLERIYEFVRRAEELSTAVAETTRRHLELIEQGLEAMENIRNISEQHAATSEEISAAAEEQSASMQELAATSEQLASLAQRLKEMASAYRL